MKTAKALALSLALLVYGAGATRKPAVAAAHA